MEKKLLDVLACPGCKGNLALRRDKLICSRCMLAYPVEEGVPVMLVDEAEKIA